MDNEDITESMSEDQVDALLKLLELSQEDFKAGRVMTREQLLEKLNGTE